MVICSLTIFSSVANIWPPDSTGRQLAPTELPRPEVAIFILASLILPPITIIIIANNINQCHSQMPIKSIIVIACIGFLHFAIYSNSLFRQRAVRLPNTTRLKLQKTFPDFSKISSRFLPRFRESQTWLFQSIASTDFYNVNRRYGWTTTIHRKSKILWDCL